MNNLISNFEYLFFIFDKRGYKGNELKEFVFDFGKIAFASLENRKLFLLDERDPLDTDSNSFANVENLQLSG